MGVAQDRDRVRAHPALAAIAVALTLAMCRQPEDPPLSPAPKIPPTPTNPTYSLATHSMGNALGSTVAFDMLETIDASITSDVGAPRDVRVLDLDTGASR